MRFHLLKHNGYNRLILIFAGWGMSPTVLADIDMPGYDLGVAWDYRDMTSTWISEIERYDEIAVVAWSFGVHAAARFMDVHPDLNITARIAVNGTRFTSDDSRGIPSAIFNATLDGLDGRILKKFNMRMCGGASAYKEFEKHLPEREIEDLREELKSFDTCEAPFMMWDKAYISKNDLIIPPVNQERVWDGEAIQTISSDGSHLPDFNAILHHSLSDKSHVAQRFRKAETTYDVNASPQRIVADKLLSHICDVLRVSPTKMLEIGCGTGLLTVDAIRRLSPHRVMLWDLHLSSQIESLRQTVKDTIIDTEECDAETEIIKANKDEYDLILSASTVQWFNSLRAFLLRVSYTLRKGGIAAISTYGPGTMKEIHETLGSRSRFPSSDEIIRAIPQTLEVVKVEEERIVMDFDSPTDALRHISDTGVNCLTSETAGVKTVNRLLREYPVRTDGKTELTYNPIYLILRKL